MRSAEFADNMGGRGIQWMKKQAALYNAVVMGSIIIKEGEHYFNRLIVADGQRVITHYDKKHLFRMGNEPNHYSNGNKQVIFEHCGFRIMPLICYDLRFPVWARNTKELNYDLQVYVANWPAVRSYPWSQLLKARAIENQAYVMGVNRVGVDGNGIDHSGNSSLIDFLGKEISNIQPNEECVKTFEIHKEPLNDFRKNFPASMDSDNFLLK